MGTKMKILKHHFKGQVDTRKERYVWTGRKWEYLDEMPDEDGDTNEHS